MKEAFFWISDHPNMNENQALMVAKIGGLTLRIGKTDLAMRKQAEAYRLRIEKLHVRGGDLSGPEASNAMAEIAAILLRQHRPEITADWLDRHMTAQQREALFDEFIRQAAESVNIRSNKA